MYAPIDPERLGMEDILRSLGTVLDDHLTRRVEIRQRRDGLVVRAEAVANIAARLAGSWSSLELVLTHMDMVQAQVAVAARRRAGHVAGSYERSLSVLGHLIDERGLRGLTLSQHPSNGAWLLWHEGSERQGLTLSIFTEAELQGLAAESAARRQLVGRGLPPTRERAWARRADGRAVRGQLSMGARDSIRVRPGRGMLAHTRAAAEA